MPPVKTPLSIADADQRRADLAAPLHGRDQPVGQAGLRRGSPASFCPSPAPVPTASRRRALPAASAWAIGGALSKSG